MHFISVFPSAAFRRHQLCSLLGCLFLITCLVACKAEPESLSEEERVQILAEASAALKEGKALRSAPQSAEDLQRAGSLLAEAGALFTQVEAYDSVYDAALNEIGSYVMLTRYERGILAFENMKTYPIADTNLLKSKLYLNAAACYASLFYPAEAIRLMDTVEAVQQRRLEMGLAGLNLATYTQSRSNLGVILMTKAVYAKEAGLQQQMDQLFQRSVFLHREALAIIPQLPQPQAAAILTPNVLNNLGLAFLHWGKLDSADRCFSEAGEKRLPEVDDGTDSDNMGTLRLYQGRYSEAIPLIQAAIQRYSQGQTANFYLAEPLTKLGVAYARQGKHEQALETYQRALRALSWSLGANPSDWLASPYDNPPLFQVANAAIYLEILEKKSSSMLAVANRNELSSLLDLLPTYHTAFAVMEALRKEGLGEQVAFMTASTGRKLTDRYLELNRQVNLLSQVHQLTKRYADLNREIIEIKPTSQDQSLPNPQKKLLEQVESLKFMYRAMEQNRANSLLRGIQMTQINLNNQLPSDIHSAEFELEAEIRGLREALYNITKSGGAGKATGVLSGQLSQSLRQKDSLLAVIEADYPGYYSLRYDTLQADFSFLQAALDKDQVLLEYFWGTNHLYTFKIRQDSVRLYIQPADSIDLWIRQLLPTISSDTTYLSGAFVQTGLQPARNLYQSLLGSVLTPEERKTSRLVLVRDSSLTQLPFQLLLASDPDEGQQTLLQDLDFAVKHHSFSYQYSAKLFAFQKDLPPSRTKGILAMAPFPPRGEGESYLEGREVILALPHSKTELAAIPGTKKSWIGRDASRENFLPVASEYAILHFSSHAEANSGFPDSSFLRFSLGSEKGSKMWAKEVAELKLRAESVVLSACETSVGTYIGGEGLLSLARAFTLAGAKHVLATQWPLVDETGAAIIGFYYEELAKGQPKDVALQQAQLRYLAEYIKRSDKRAHPYWWAALISIGSDSPVDRYF